MVVWRDDLRNQLVRGSLCQQSSAFEFAVTHAQVVGNLQVIDQIEGLDYEALITGVEE